MRSLRLAIVLLLSSVLVAACSSRSAPEGDAATRRADGGVTTPRESRDAAPPEASRGDAAPAKIDDADLPVAPPEAAVKTKWVRIEPGSFEMGSRGRREPGRDRDEGLHKVTISRPFLLSETEVTQGDWEKVMKRNPARPLGCGSGCPMVQVSWWDALAYCNARSRAEELEECYDLSSCRGALEHGRVTTCGNLSLNKGLDCQGYRLPTESEWEYATRAGTSTATFAGKIVPMRLGCRNPHPVLDRFAWFCGNASFTLHEARTLEPNPWGLYDTIGSVWEWVWDRYGEYPNAPAVDPLGAERGDNRVVRGGSWFVSARLCRSATRWGVEPGYRAHDIGLRLAKTPPSEQ